MGFTDRRRRAILLLIPRLSGLGGLLLFWAMISAVITHLFIVGGSPLMATILLVVTGVVAWGRRQRTLISCREMDSAAGLSWVMKSISSSMLRPYLKTVEANRRQTQAEGRGKK